MKKLCGKLLIWFRSLSLRKQMVLGNLLPIVLCITIVGGIGYKIINNQTWERFGNTNSKNIEQISGLIEREISQLDKITLEAYVSDEVTGFLHNRAMKIMFPERGGEEKASSESLFAYLEEVMFVNIDIWSVTVCDIEGKAYTVSKNGYERRNADFFSDSYYAPLHSSNGELTVLPAKVSSGCFYSDEEVVTVGRKLIDSGSSDSLGIFAGSIIVEYSVSSIRELLENTGTVNSGEIAVFSSDGGTVFSEVPDLELTAAELEDLNNMSPGEGLAKRVNEQKQLLFASESDLSGWTCVLQIPYRQALEEVVSIFALFIAAFVICVFGVIMVNLLFAQNIINPINGLKKMMKNYNLGDAGENVQTKYSNEFDELSDQYKELLSRINFQIQENSRLIEENSSLEMKMLFDQINPHFLYNTLESIRMLALMGENEKTADSISQLGRFLRRAISRTQTLVRADEEIAHVKTYINLQKLRYPKRFDVLFDIDESINDCMMLKFTLQPLIENSITHGFASVRSGGIISVCAYTEKKYAVFSVSDNGCGITEERLREINEGVFENGGDHIGLKNVNRRLQLAFGEHILVQSKKGKGTIVTFKIPQDTGGK